MNDTTAVPVRQVEKLRDILGQITSKQFDQLISFLLQELDPESTVEFVPTDSDSQVDMDVSLEHPFVDVSYGIRLEHRSPEEFVGEDLVASFNTNLQDRGLQTGVIITTGDFSDSARRVAEQHNISLLSGDRLATLLVSHELGFRRTGETITIDESFWELLSEPERTKTIPSIEVPQADSIERLDQTLQAVSEGNHEKSVIAQTIQKVSDDTFSPRQVDYYATAGWLLGFLHKGYQPDSCRSQGRWDLTRLGTTYLTHRNTGNEDAARRILYAQIRQIEVVRRVLRTLQEERVLSREDVLDIVAEETELAGTTIPRRTRTLINWLAHLPEIETKGRGSSQRIRHLVDDAMEDGTDTQLQENTTNSEPSSEGRTDYEDGFEDEDILDDIVDSFDLSLTKE